MTDYKAMCAELLAELENAIRVIYHEDGTRHISAADAVIARARAALAQPEPPDAREVEKLSEAPAAWLYRGDPDFDGTTWRVNWHVTTDERVARFKAQPIKPIPLFRHPVALAEPESPVDGEND